MARILIGWELGKNLGHLTRLLPIAQRLQDCGNSVLVAARDLRTATSVLRPAGIPFVQAPLGEGNNLISHPTGYADTLLAVGWHHESALGRQVQAWITLYQSFAPDVLVLDYSPTARLAAMIMHIPCVLIGCGFDLPPATYPLPPYPGFSWATSAKAAESEQHALAVANTVLQTYKAPQLDGLYKLFDAEAKLLFTFPEIDHYGPRHDVHYVGPIEGMSDNDNVDWPKSDSDFHIYAYLRSEMGNLDALLAGLVQSQASVICYAPDVAPALLDQYRQPRIVFSARPVNFSALFAQADVCFSYSALTTVTRFLLHGVPQLLLPRVTEGQLSARRVEDLGAGILLRGPQTANGITAMLERLRSDPHYAMRATAFADQYRTFDVNEAADNVVTCIQQIAN